MGNIPSCRYIFTRRQKKAKVKNGCQQKTAPNSDMAWAEKTHLAGLRLFLNCIPVAFRVANIHEVAESGKTNDLKLTSNYHSLQALQWDTLPLYTEDYKQITFAGRFIRVKPRRRMLPRTKKSFQRAPKLAGRGKSNNLERIKFNRQTTQIKMLLRTQYCLQSLRSFLYGWI